MNSVFFKDFLMISEIKTIIFIVILFAIFYGMKIVEKKKRFSSWGCYTGSIRFC